MNKRFALVALLLAMVMLLSGCNLIGYDKELDGAQVVAKVNGTEVTKAEWEAYRDYLASYYQQYYQQYFGVSMPVSYTHLDVYKRQVCAVARCPQRDQQHVLCIQRSV